MPTYQQIMEMDFSSLAKAADGWKKMAARFKTLEDVFQKDVQSVSIGQGWQGESANSSIRPFAVTLGEYSGARTEARAMESLLRDAHSTFVELQSRLKSAVQDARDGGMKLSEGGVASFDFSKVDASTANAVRHDPSLRDTEHAYTRRIADAVQAVNEFDEDVKRALLNASGADGTSLFGFNSKAVGDVEAVEVLALSDKIRAGYASAAELKHYRDVLRQNSGDKHFSEAYLHALGGKDALLLADQMNLAANERGLSASDKKLYESISTGLANTIASGTKDPDSYAYKSFVNGLKAHGDDSWNNLKPVHGYQVLATLMRNGEGYGKEFLNDIANGIIATENDKPRIWAHAYDNERPNLAADPLDALLGIMSKDPDAATYILDPAAEGNKNNHLEYLLTKREWSDSYMAPLYGAPRDIEDPFKASGLGAAIQSAATGHAPGEKLGPPGPHTEGQARVMHNAIRLLDAEMKGDEFPNHLSALRQPMAMAMADYVADTHVTLAGQESNYGGVGGSESIYGAGKEAHIAVGQGSLVRVMRGIADDAPAFSLLYDAERAYGASVLDQAPGFSGTVHESSEDWNNRASGIGNAMGVLNGIGADVYADKHDDREKWAEKTANYSVNGVNGLIGEIPLAGSAASSLVDTIGFNWEQGIKDDAENEAKKQGSNNYAAGADGLNQMIQKWGDREGVSKDNAFDAARREANNSFTSGRDAARTHLQSPKGG